MARNLFDEQGREVFKEEIQSSGVRGIFILLGLQGVEMCQAVSDFCSFILAFPLTVPVLKKLRQDNVLTR